MSLMISYVITLLLMVKTSQFTTRCKSDRVIALKQQKSNSYNPQNAAMSVSVCLWRLCIVVTGCNGSRIPLHAWIDGCLCYLLTSLTQIV